MNLRNYIFKTRKCGCFVLTVLTFASIEFKAQTTRYPLNDPRNPNCPCHKYQKLADEEYKKLLANANPKPVIIHKKITPQQKIQQVILSKENGTSESDEFLSKNPLDENGISESENLPSKRFLINDRSTSEKEITKSNNSFSKTSFSGSSGSSNKKKHAHTKLKRKKRNCHYKKWHRILEVRSWDIWKEFRDISSCYHWK